MFTLVEVVGFCLLGMKLELDGMIDPGPTTRGPQLQAHSSGPTTQGSTTPGAVPKGTKGGWVLGPAFNRVGVASFHFASSFPTRHVPG
jgi:hypothetical protein